MYFLTESLNELIDGDFLIKLFS